MKELDEMKLSFLFVINKTLGYIFGKFCIGK